MKKVTGFLVLFVLFSSLCFAAGARQQAATDFPTKPIQLIIPWPAGGRTDINARLFANNVTQYLGQPMVPVNREGGASMIGGDFVAKAAPDGYTLLAITPGTNILPPLFRGAPYGPYDFDAIGQIGSSTMVMASHPDRPWKNVTELVEYAKRNPGQVTYSCVALNAPMLGFLMWADRVGAQFRHVPVNADGQAVEQALGGHVDIAMSSSIAPVFSHVNTGALNALMVFSEKRDNALPNVPTAKELGHDVVVSPYTGIAGPKGMPKDVLEKLRAVFKQVVEDPEFARAIQNSGENFDPVFGDDFLKIWQTNYEGYSAIVNKMGIKP